MQMKGTEKKLKIDAKQKLKNNKFASAYTPSQSNQSSYSINSINSTYSTATLEYDLNSCAPYKNAYILNKKQILNSLFSNSTLSIGTIRALLADPETKNDIDFTNLVKTQTLNLSFITDFYSQLPKSVLFQIQELPEDFIEQHIHEFLSGSAEDNEILESISLKQNISFDFIKKYHEYFEWYNIFKNHNLKFTIKLLIDNQQYFTDQDYKNIIYIKNIDELINDFILHVDIENLDKLEWSYISWNLPLKENTINYCLDYLDFNSNLLSHRKFKNDQITCFRLLKYGF